MQRCSLFVGNSVERRPAGLGHVANVLPWTVQAARSQPFQRAEGLGVSAHVHSHHPPADWEQRYLVDITRGKWLLDTSCYDPSVCARVCKAYPPSFTATVYQNHRLTTPRVPPSCMQITPPSSRHRVDTHGLTKNNFNHSQWRIQKQN